MNKNNVMLKKQLAIISGTSRGIGKGMLVNLLEKGIQTLTINRSTQEVNHVNHLGNITYDLMHLDGLDALVEEIDSYIAPEEIGKIWLFNNAAIIGEINPFGRSNPQAIKDTINLDLLSPMMLSSMLLSKTSSMGIPLRMVHISSGVAFQAIHGLGPYCVSKAGLEMFSKMLSEENKESDFSSITIGPGVVDTGMQEQIREASPESFNQLERFKDFHSSGMLQTSTKVGKSIIDFVLKDEFQSGNYYEINNL